VIDLFSIELMLAKKSPPFSRAGWIYELKYDGYRVVASNSQIVTRAKKDATSWYPEIVAPLSKLKKQFVIDCEVCILDAAGRPDFEQMRARTVRKSGVPVTLFAFDLLFLSGKDLRHLPLTERKRRLRSLIPRDHTRLRYIDHIETEGEVLFNYAKQIHMEGIMAKKADSAYIGERSKDWLKMKPAGWHDGWERPNRRTT
jgi:bifunctional non-homologous end joining protein LigD